MKDVEFFEDAVKAGLMGEEDAPCASPEQSGLPLEGVADDDAPALIEALILASGEGLSIERIGEVTKLSESVIEAALGTIEERCRAAQHGFELVLAAGQYQFRTRARFAPYVQALKAERPRRLTNAALETLAVIAYRQPIVKSDIEKIRGVDATPTLKTLLDRQLIRIVGHKATVGQPALYGTTDQFLKLFGLNSLAELPTLRDLKDLESDPGEAGERLGELENADPEEASAQGASPESAVRQ